MKSAAKYDSEDEEQPSKKFKSSSKPFGGWQSGLLQTMKDDDSKVFEDDQLVVIKDKYPKARFHFLVLPKKDISSLTAVTKNDVDLLKHMDLVGHDIASKHDIKKFRFGYHAVPSMSRLHLHVISEDFDSVCLKTKKHWNSFTTDFFRNSSDVINELEQNGSVQKMDSKTCETLMKQELKCHLCSKCFPTIPKLKAHLPSHKVWT